ncbi:hypothetical protein [Peribacillus frigoritolerans]
MIEKFFKKPHDPMIFNDGLLKKGEKEYFVIQKIYLFIATHSMKVQEIGNSWITNRIDVERTFRGYFYISNNSLLLPADNFSEEIMLIADKGGKQFQINGVSVGDIKNHFGEKGSYTAAKFSAISVKIIDLKED